MKEKQGLLVAVIAVMLVMLVMPLGVSGQELSPIMEEVKTLCLDTRNAIGRRDTNSITECKNKVASFYRKYDNSVCNLKLKPVDPGQEEMDSTRMRPILDEKYLEYVEETLSDIGYKGHSQNRGASSGLGLAHKGIPAHSTMSYSVEGCSNNMQLVVVVAEAQNINLSVTSKLYDGDGTMVKQEVMPSGKYGEYAHLWRMPKGNGTVILTIENPNDQDVTCVIAMQ